MNLIDNKCRFCYSYKPTGFIDNCCAPPICSNNTYINQISSLSVVVNNSTRTSEQSLLLGLQTQYLTSQSYQATSNTVYSTIVNSAPITSTLYGQLLNVQKERYLPYQPKIYPTIPPSVLELQRSTINVGVPYSFFTCADRKGVQSVTT